MFANGSTEPRKFDKQRCAAAAAHAGHEPILRCFVELGADILADGNKCMRLASSPAVVRFLVGLGADIHAGDDECVRYALANGHLMIVKCLVGLGANIHANDGEAIRWTRR